VVVSPPGIKTTTCAIDVPPAMLAVWECRHHAFAIELGVAHNRKRSVMRSPLFLVPEGLAQSGTVNQLVENQINESNGTAHLTQQRLYSVNEASTILGISVSFLYRKARQFKRTKGKEGLPHYRVGSSPRFQLDEVKTFLREKGS
jgi:excisionase family DNA binding protein